jgi:hypothetical protein
LIEQAEIQIQFWNVPRGHNADADRLANIALTEYMDWGVPPLVSRPEKSWKYESACLSSAKREKKLAAYQVIQRLELPLEPVNRWTGSVVKFLIKQSLQPTYQRLDDRVLAHSKAREILTDEGGTNYPLLFKTYFGPDWQTLQAWQQKSVFYRASCVRRP